MSPHDELEARLRRLRRRVRRLLIERYGLFGAGLGAVVAGIIVLLSGRYDGLVNYWLWAVVFIVPAILGALYGLLRKLSDLSVAIAADDRTGLKERLSTAVALRSPSPRPSPARGEGDMDPMQEALITDANEHISSFRPNEVFRHRFGRPHLAAGITMLFFLGAVIVPHLPVFQSKTRRQETVVMKQEGKKLVKIAKDIKKQSPSTQKELRKLANRLAKLGDKMQTGRMSRKQAMLRTQKLSKEVQKQQDRLARENSSKKSMEKARADMLKAARELEKRKAEEIAKKENIPLSEAMKKVPSDKRLAELARKDGPLTKSEQQELEEALAKYADPDNQLPIRSELASALAKLAESKDYQKAMELMKKLSKKLASGKMNQMDQKSLEQQLEQLAKALKNTDLDKLAQQMLQSAEKLANMSDEELEKLLEQMKQAEQMAQSLAKAGEG